MVKHSNYSPSRLSRIIACPGSVELIENLMSTGEVREEEPSTYASDGTMLHKVMEKYYSNDFGSHYTEALDGLKVDNKALILDAAEYLDLVFKSLGHRNLTVRSEISVSLKSWGIPDVYGTLDYVIGDLVKRHVHVLDWKFGAGVTVYAKDNPQLLAYAAGVVKWPTVMQDITIHIVQPAIDHYDTWKCSINELYAWVHGTLAIALNKCHSSGPDEFVPGVEQCRWCEAKNHCEARVTFAQETAVKLFDAKEKLATCPTIEDLIELVTIAPLVSDAIKSVRLYLQNELEKGNAVPGLKLVQGRANRKWVNENEAITWLAKNTSIEELFASKLRSPSQMEKEARNLKKSEGFKKLYEKPAGKITMVSESDGRPAIQTDSGAIDVFAKVNNG